MHMCIYTPSILRTQKCGEVAENHDFQIHLKADRIESRDLPQTIRDPAYASSPVSSLHWRNPGENLSDFENFPAETWFLPDFSLRGYEIFCRACLPRNFRRASPPPSSPDFFQIFEKNLKKVQKRKKSENFRKKLFFQKVMKHREKHSPSRFFNFFTYFNHFFNIFDFLNFFIASYRLSRAFMAPRVLAMSNHAFTAPTALTRVYTMPLRSLEL